MTKYKHIIWDWNGTLLNDRWLCVAVINDMLAPRGLPAMTEARYRGMFDFPVKDYYVRLGFDFQQEAFEKVAIEFIDVYHKRWPECELQPGTLEVLPACAKLGLSQSVLSAMEHNSLVRMIGHFELEPYFKELVGIDDHYADGKIENGKRHLRQLGLQPAEVLFIGDTVHDFDVATAIGVDCLLLTHGHHATERSECDRGQDVGLTCRYSGSVEFGVVFRLNKSYFHGKGRHVASSCHFESRGFLSG